MEAKILITVSGGIITSFWTNMPDCKVLIVDYDLVEDDVDPVHEVEGQNGTFEDGKSYLIFTDDEDEADKEIAATLKALNY